MDKKSQIIGEVFKYMLIAIFSMMILFAGYKTINAVRGSSCNTEFSKFEIDLKGLDQELRYGEKESRSFQTPCNVEQILLFDHTKEINEDFFSDIPILEEAVKNKTRDNVYLIKNSDIVSSFYAGNLDMQDPYYICFVPKFEKIAFLIEGKGTAVSLEADSNQPECTFKPVTATEAESTAIMSKGNEICPSCPDASEAAQQSELARSNANANRGFKIENEKTKVVIKIRVRDGIRLRNFVYYESIPKDCVGNLNDYLDEKTDGGATITVKNDEMIIWTFNELIGKKEVSYTLNRQISDQCQKLFKGLYVVKEIEGISKQHLATNSNSGRD